ncbi:MAG: hypothetical protein GWM98_29760, partial [Nitrospinaceae bacterium]|nr:hypothetical protein [Nitrospinaceae bacterium]NIU47372.1 hypothetical protein [Nitrospinaceae bacterium]NIU99590.1 hypothetical protein [Nitrospinaceae bacterium]NIW62121.1 hypothetical protein [Nitrospinaceae bacterium]NIY18742.1 hypothetical protein [Nitrospinaceae bacterium]
MTPLRKWLLVLVAVVFVGSLFGDKLITFYIDWLWFDSLGFVQVLWTLLGAQFGL